MNEATKKIFTVVRVILARLRFMAVFAVAALVVGKWDLIVNRVDQWTRPAVAPDSLMSEIASDTEWYCPMDGAVEDHPGPCPNCGMPLVKRKKNSNQGLPVDVLARVQLTPRRLALANISTSLVAYKDLASEVKTVGFIDYDQSRLFDLAARLAGRADEVYVNFIGQTIKPGEALYSIYSPDAYTALREYLLARQREGAMTRPSADASGAMMPDAMMDAASLRQAAARKLDLWGVGADQLAQIAAEFDKSGQVPDHLKVLARAGGIVTRKELRPGGYVAAGDVPFAVADLSTVWLNAKIYESDVPLVQIGQMVDVTATAAPGRMFAGKVTFLAFQLDPQARTLDARVEIPNTDLILRPGMFATAVLRPTATRQLAVPRSAVINTGEARIVYVRSSTGAYDMHAVKLGPECGEDYPVLSGLKDGDQVVSHGAFLVDAENRLNPPSDSPAPAAKPNAPANTAMPAGMQMP